MKRVNGSILIGSHRFVVWLRLVCLGLVFVGVGCTPQSPPDDVDGSKSPKTEEKVDSQDSSIPGTVKLSSFLPRETEDKRLAQSTYTVVVTDVPVREVLFALARDAHLNVDIVPGITGNVTLNAIDQTLPRILERISHQSNIRYRIKDNVLSVEPDLPFRRNYRVDYVSATRTMESEVSIATTVASTGANSPSINNSSTVKLGTASNFDFWKNLIANLTEIVGKPEPGVDKPDEKKTDTKDEKKDENKTIIWNESTGVISVLATAKKHDEVRAFIDRVVNSAQRQVLIEATVAEVRLSDQYQSGIDWGLVKRNGSTDTGNFASMLANRMTAAPLAGLTLNQATMPFFSDVLGGRDVTATLRMLSQFGKTKVLSSPRITVLNNQTAILRVTTNEVYFQLQVSPPTYNENGSVRTSGVIETQIRTVPLGFIMQVTPQISESEVITLNIRPTIQRVEKWVDNPDPYLRWNLPVDAAFVPPQVPVVQVQEMDSVLRVPNGQVMVMGGLMENSLSKESDGVPMFSDLPVVGKLFGYRDEKNSKSELVIFLRPVVTAEPRNLLNPHDQQFYSDKDLPSTSSRIRDQSIL